MSSTPARTAPCIVVIGRQGSGKGEQCRRLSDRFGLEHISTGELLRAAERDDTPLGRAVAGAMAHGEPVSDDIVAGVVAERLASAAIAGRGVALDGYPRTVAQAQRLAALLAPASVDLVIHLDVPRSVAVTRIQNRRICKSCHGATTHARCPICDSPTERRSDDWPAAIGRRMSDYARELGPLLDWYEANATVVTVDGTGTQDDVAAQIARAIEALVPLAPMIAGTR